MNTKVLLGAAAAFMALIAVGLLFLPQELMAFLGVPENTFILIIIQVLGALYLGMAILNWMSRGNIVGGIYSRPLVVANLTHFFITATVFIKAIINSSFSLTLLIPGVLFSIFALLFGMLLFTHPGDK